MSVRRAVAVFALSGLATLIIIVASLAYLLPRAGHDEAVHDAQQLVGAYGVTAVHPALTDGLLDFDATAMAAFAATMRDRLDGSPFSRVKLWRADGTILYSDEPRLIGNTFALDDVALRALQAGQPVAEVSDTSKPENAFERMPGDLLEVYQRLATPGGTPVLFEAYLPFDSVQAEGRKIWLAFAPIVLVSLMLLWLLQLPFAWSMARQLRAGQQERERLLRRTIEVSDIERRTLAADLHNGVVQTLAGMAFSLGALEQHLPDDASSDVRAQVSEASIAARSAIRELRSMLVNLYPPTLRQSGLESSLTDLAAHLQARGIATIVSVDLPERPDASVEALLYRSAQEALRNVVKHAAASHAEVNLRRDGRDWYLSVVDDGRVSFVPDQAPAPGSGERIGLRLLAEMVRDAEGQLNVAALPGGGTQFVVRIPVRASELVDA